MPTYSFVYEQLHLLSDTYIILAVVKIVNCFYERCSNTEFKKQANTYVWKVF